MAFYRKSQMSEPLNRSEVSNVRGEETQWKSGLGRLVRTSLSSPMCKNSSRCQVIWTRTSVLFLPFLGGCGGGWGLWATMGQCLGVAPNHAWRILWSQQLKPGLPVCTACAPDPRTHSLALLITEHIVKSA